MSHLPISRSPDLTRLRQEGYDIRIQGGFLVISHVPYVNSAKKVQFGRLVSKLDLAGDRTVQPETHVIFFDGEYPCNKDGTEIGQIKHGSSAQTLAEGLVVSHSFSNKPANGYTDYYEKITRYVEIISHPARAIDPTVTAKTFVVQPDEPDSVFEYIDTASSRAGIGSITAKLKDLKVAIVGLGGTGAYVLDLVAKTPASEIHLWDGDRLGSHNAFRSPGAASVEKLREHPFKTDYFKSIYSAMHRRVHSHPEFITSENVTRLGGMDFVFVCIDASSIKALIQNQMEASGVPFIDVGMGITATDGALSGILRTTTSTRTRRDHVMRRVSSENPDEDEYATNIQIADLNMLNAALAVVKWKKLCGFYHDFRGEHHSTYTIDVDMLLNEDCDA